MGALSRRRVLGAVGATAIGLGVGSRVGGMALAQSPKIRYSAHSDEGRAMLKSYAAAFQTMMSWDASKSGDPRSALFQWYTHGVPSNTNKESEIKRIYGADPNGANAQLAQAMWNTCQPHYSNGDSDSFLPWHRMFVLFFGANRRRNFGEREFYAALLGLHRPEISVPASRVPDAGGRHVWFALSLKPKPQFE